MDSLSGRLKSCRRHFGWTQQDLAHESGVGLVTIRRIEQAEFEPRLQTVRRLAATLRVREAWLAFGDEPGENRFMDEEEAPRAIRPRDERQVDITRIGQKRNGDE